MANKVTLSWRAESAIVRALKKVAAKKGVGHSTMVRIIVKEYLDQQAASAAGDKT